MISFKYKKYFKNLIPHPTVKQFGRKPTYKLIKLHYVFYSLLKFSILQNEKIHNLFYYFSIFNKNLKKN